MKKTSDSYDAIVEKCLTLFEKKMNDYGSTWRVLRILSLTDQIFIKARRIRQIQTVSAKINEGEESEFIGVVNYCIMALIQLEKGIAKQPDLNTNEAVSAYKYQMDKTKKLMHAKNHDYGEAWRDMRISSLTDLILQKLLRVKQIEDNKGKTSVSEGVDSNYQDIINYAIFALILLYEKNNL